MSEKAPEVVGFDRLETQLVREAIRSAGELYIEEIARNAVKHYPNDKARQNDFITSTWTYATTFDLFHLLNEANMTALWHKIRETTALSATILNTAVKLRGMYSDGDWSALIAQLGAGVNIMHAAQYSVMDETVTKPVDSTAKPSDRLSHNAWVVPLLLMSYAPLVTVPATLKGLLHVIDTAQSARGAVS